MGVKFDVMSSACIRNASVFSSEELDAHEAYKAALRAACGEKFPQENPEVMRLRAIWLETI